MTKTESWRWSKWGLGLGLFWEDIWRFSCAIRKEIPNAIFFPADFHSNPLVDRLFNKKALAPIEEPSTYPDIFSCIHGFQAYDDWTVGIHLASDADIASGDPLRLIGGRVAPHAIYSRRKFRAAGPTAYVYFMHPEQRFLRLVYEHRESVQRASKLPRHRYPAIRTIDNQPLIYDSRSFFLYGHYDSEDPIGVGFAKLLKSLLRRNATAECALYDPATGEIVKNDHRHFAPLSRFAFEYCALHDDVYMWLGEIVDGVQTWIGPRKKFRDHVRTIGPSILEPRFRAEDFHGWRVKPTDKV